MGTYSLSALLYGVRGRVARLSLFQYPTISLWVVLVTPVCIRPISGTHRHTNGWQARVSSREHPPTTSAVHSVHRPSPDGEPQPDKIATAVPTAEGRIAAATWRSTSSVSPAADHGAVTSTTEDLPSRVEATLSPPAESIGVE